MKKKIQFRTYYWLLAVLIISILAIGVAGQYKHYQTVMLFSAMGFVCCTALSWKVSKYIGLNDRKRMVKKRIERFFYILGASGMMWIFCSLLFKSYDIKFVWYEIIHPKEVWMNIAIILATIVVLIVANYKNQEHWKEKTVHRRYLKRHGIDPDKS